VGAGGFAARRPVANRAGAARCHVTLAKALIHRQCRQDLGRVVKITSFLAGQAFEPETIRDMADAFVGVCNALDLNVGDDPATRLVAQKIIALAQRGIRDAASLRLMTLKEFNFVEK
jgi:hypothetical protein